MRQYAPLLLSSLNTAKQIKKVLEKVYCVGEVKAKVRQFTPLNTAKQSKRVLV